LPDVPHRLGRRTLLAMLAALAAPRLAAASDFAAWIEELRREAAGRGIGGRTLESALAGLRPIPRIIELDRRQPEGRLTFREYRGRVISDARVAGGRARIDRHGDLLGRVAGQYGVPPRVIVALWGIESSYGQSTGGFPVIGALATLAHDGRRADFFRSELMHALGILDNGDVAPGDMMGSWAGAMGQCQFMPSSYVRFAVDYDGDGRRDIWDSLPDVFASMSNYLRGHGWRPGYTWGRAVRLTRSVPGELTGTEVRRPLAFWQQQGVRTAAGGPLPQVAIEASLIRTDDGAGPSFLVYDNYRVFLRWNRSQHFALSVGTLADRIG
jgi:membrane-bound lytic murein transglycosylase B